LNFESWSEAGNPAERPPKFNLGEERIFEENSEAVVPNR